MANRNFQSANYTNVVDVVKIYAKITAAADVAADGYTVTTGGAYVTSVARTGEGDATITLTDGYNIMLGCVATISKADTTLQWVSEDVDATTPVILVTFVTAGSAADPDSAVIYLEITLRNSSVS